MTTTAALGYLNVRQNVIDAAMLRSEHFFKGMDSYKAAADTYLPETLGGAMIRSLLQESRL